MRRLIASLALAIAMMAALASPSFAATNGHFPEGVVGGAACEVLAGNEATLSNPPAMPASAKNPPNPKSGADGSDNGFFNKFDLFTDACLGG